MSSEEMEQAVPLLRQAGNKLYSNHQFAEASYKYRKALTILEQLMTREKPGEEEWLVLDREKMIILSNLSQCELMQRNYYDVIKYTDEVVQKDKDNVKALFRRAQAHAAVYNFDEAKRDFARVVHLDGSLANAVKKHLTELDKQYKLKTEEDKLKLKGKLFG